MSNYAARVLGFYVAFVGEDLYIPGYAMSGFYFARQPGVG